MDFATYDTLKKMVPHRADGSIDPKYTLCCGAVGGTVGQTVSYPLELVRRRLQVQDIMHKYSGSATPVTYKGMTDALIKIYREEGFRGYYKGLWPNYLKVVPSISGMNRFLLLTKR